MHDLMYYTYELRKGAGVFEFSSHNNPFFSMEFLDWRPDEDLNGRWFDYC